MRLLPLTLVAALLAATLGTTAPASAQERSWSVSLLAETGVVIPIRTMGKNAGDLQQQSDEQVVGELEDAVTVGGGIEVEMPDRQLRFRALYNQTVGGSVLGRLGFCGDPDNPLITGQACEAVRADATLRSFTLDVGFVRRPPEARFRPVIYIGLGLRQYDIGELTCPFPPDYQYSTCDLLGELWAEPRAAPPGDPDGIDVNAGPVEFRTTFLDNVGSYRGGNGTSDGNNQNDVTLQAGLAIKVF